MSSPRSEAGRAYVASGFTRTVRSGFSRTVRWYVASGFSRIVGSYVASGFSRTVAMAIASAIALAVRPTEAHKPVTSPYTYNAEVFPILRDRCGRCHAAGGVAPMSLMTYKDAFPWGESIRTELVAGHMPPWTVDEAAGKFRNAQTLTARELNVLLTWVTGGNPVGNLETTLLPVEARRGWPIGTPDVVLPFPSEFTIAADKTDDTQEFTVPVGIDEPRWVRAVDLLPGNAAIVRSATISVKEAAPERVLAVWLPGDDPASPGGGAAFRLPANANLVVRVHYKKTWENERLALSDRSSIGLYFASAATKEVRALTLTPGAARVVDEDLDAIAIYPEGDLSNTRVAVSAERPDGSRAELIRFRPQRDWARRYWFTEPVPLPKGTRITVVGAFDDTPPPPGAPVSVTQPLPPVLRLTLNVVSTR